MNDAAVVARLMATERGFLLQQQQARTWPGLKYFQGRRQPDNAAADHAESIGHGGLHSRALSWRHARASPGWCPWPDSNGHVLRQQILSLPRLPVPPQGLPGAAPRIWGGRGAVNRRHDRF